MPSMNTSDAPRMKTTRSQILRQRNDDYRRRNPITDTECDDDEVFHPIPTVKNCCFLCHSTSYKTPQEMLDHLSMKHPAAISSVKVMDCSMQKNEVIKDLGLKYDEIHKRVVYSPDDDTDEYFVIGRFHGGNTMIAMPECYADNYTDKDTLYHWDNGFNHSVFNCSFMQYKGYPWCICALNNGD